MGWGGEVLDVRADIRELELHTIRQPNRVVGPDNLLMSSIIIVLDSSYFQRMHAPEDVLFYQCSDGNGKFKNEDYYNFIISNHIINRDDDSNSGWPEQKENHSRQGHPPSFHTRHNIITY